MTVLQELLPKEQVESYEHDHQLLGNTAGHIVYPKTEDEIAAILKFADKSDNKVIPVSGGTKRGFGGLQEKADLLLSLSKFKGIVEHTTGDLTMTVRPGTTMKEIVDYLAAHDQMIPLDPSWPEYATIGGVVAANDSGPKRLKYGSARDSVIGLRIVYPDGRVIRTGGKVVKNVAGYDMNKLFVGSMGTLGVISEITLKLRPVPKHESLVLVTFSQHETENAIRSFARTIMSSMMEPVSLELLNPAAALSLTGNSEYTLAITFEDREKAVHYQEEWVRKNLPPNADMQMLQQQEAKDWWAQFNRLAPNGAIETKRGEQTIIALKIGSKIIDVIHNIHTASELAQEKQIAIKAHGGIGHGISRVYATGDPGDLLSFAEKFRNTVEEKQGYVIATHMPFAMRKQFSVWGNHPSYFTLLEGIKRTVDPNGILNHQRFVGGL